LIVGVTVDELVEYKGKKSVIPFDERIQVVRACKYVDTVIPQTSIDKIEAIKKINASLLFVGDDWYKAQSWTQMENQLNQLNCDVIYFPYSQGTSSTLINDTLTKLRNNKDLL